MRTPVLLVFCLILLLSKTNVGADALTVDASNVSAPASIDLGQGTNTDPAGHAWTADSQCLYLDGKPFVPIVGEFHYSRYPRAEWREELLKMKAGGINTVSSYIIWNHQEEAEGKFDWSDRRSLRDFVQLCKDVGLYSIIRIGPWDHAEVRNGGFPDWVKVAPKNRTKDPALLPVVQTLFDQIGGQVKGLLWKDGGPVIAAQMDNEVSGVPYLMTLKKMARDAGIDVPFYTMTGWNHVALPQDQLLPLFGAYGEGFWTSDSAGKFARVYFFSPLREDSDMGASLSEAGKGRAEQALKFPYVCCEIGSGMQSSVTKRIDIDPADIAVVALTRLGNGSNMPGYYMYQGGINPDGLTHLNEEKPNPMPVKDYDFNAPLGACGEIRGQYHLLREQHLFLEDFGAELATMPAFFPSIMPANNRDIGSVRWDVRSNGKSGFLFFTNHSRYDSLPDHPGAQFAIKLKDSTLSLPQEPVTIPADSFGFFPFNLDCGGVTLRYATAQPLARVTDANGTWYFFTAINGIAPDFNFDSTKAVFKAGTSDKDADGLRVRQIKPSTAEAFHFELPEGRSVHFVVLSSEQAQQLYRVTLAGKDCLVLSQATPLVDQDGLHLLANAPGVTHYGIFSPEAAASKERDGVFAQVESTFPAVKPVDVAVEQDAPGAPAKPGVNPLDDASWINAASWKLKIPSEASGRHLLLAIHYVGNAARLYDGDRLLDDNLYDGRPFDVGLWRIPVEDYGKLRIRILPWSDDLKKAVSSRVAAEAASAHSTEVTVTTTEQVEASTK